MWPFRKPAHTAFALKKAKVQANSLGLGLKIRCKKPRAEGVQMRGVSATDAHFPGDNYSSFPSFSKPKPRRKQPVPNSSNGYLYLTIYAIRRISSHHKLDILYISMRNKLQPVTSAAWKSTSAPQDQFTWTEAVLLLLKEPLRRASLGRGETEKPMSFMASWHCRLADGAISVAICFQRGCNFGLHESTLSAGEVVNEHMVGNQYNRIFAS
jgi:hypothetical protein